MNGTKSSLGYKTIDSNHMRTVSNNKKHIAHRKRIPSILGPHKIALSPKLLHTHEIVFDLGMQIIDTKTALV